MPRLIVTTSYLAFSLLITTCFHLANLEAAPPSATLDVPLPTNFPKDVPMFPKATIKSASDFGQMLNVGCETDAKIEEVVKFYREKMFPGGWKKIMEMQQEKSAMLMFKKDTRTCQIGIGQRRNKKKLYFTINIMKKK